MQDQACLVLRQGKTERYAHDKYGYKAEIEGRLSHHFDRTPCVLPRNRAVFLGQHYISCRSLLRYGSLYLRSPEQSYEEVAPRAGQRFGFINRHGNLVIFRVVAVEDAMISLCLEEEEDRHSLKWQLFEVQINFFPL